MATEVKMPQLGETVVEGTITKWLKQEGDTVEEDELLVEISTDKVDSEVPSSAAGTIQKILVQEGDTVSVGTPLAVIGDGEAGGGSDDSDSDSDSDSADGEAKAEASSDEKPEGQGGEQVAQEQGSGDAASTDAGQTEGDATPGQEEKRREDVGESKETESKADEGGDDTAAEPSARGSQPESAPAEAAAQIKERQSGGSDGSKRGIISPLVRRLADENDVDLGEVAGTGTGGRIRKQDVLRFVEERKSRPAAPAAAAASGGGAAPKPQQREQEAPRPAAVARSGEREELVPWTNIRRRTAEHMVASSHETARAWNAVEADWTNIVKLRGRAKGRFQEREGFNLTFMPFLAKAVCETLMEMPEVNATFDEENQANLVKHYVNLGIAVALEGGGLIVPVIHGADEKNLVGLARSINDIATRARTKKLTPDDLTGGTFTITNPGPFGSKMSVPIIPRGQAAILAFEAIEKRVVVTEDDSIGIRSMGFLPMSWDHRIIDGAEAAKFLARLRERIETTDFSADISPYL
jgi:2-oxoglutarate dehydrogenase E2 component (dihydrolipoamide succinyltransferase)